MSALEQKSKLLNAEKIDLDKINLLNKKIKKLQREQSNNIKNYNNSIKKLISNYNSNAEIRLSGIPMIADDMITFIKKTLLFWIWCFCVYFIHALAGIQKYKLGFISFVNMCSFNHINDWFLKALLDGR